MRFQIDMTRMSCFNTLLYDVIRRSAVCYNPAYIAVKDQRGLVQLTGRFLPLPEPYPNPEGTMCSGYETPSYRFNQLACMPTSQSLFDSITYRPTRFTTCHQNVESFMTSRGAVCVKERTIFYINGRSPCPPDNCRR